MHRSLGSALMSVVMTVAGAAMLGVAGYSLLSGQSLCSMATGGSCEAKATGVAALPAGHANVEGKDSCCPLTAARAKQVAASHSHCAHGGHNGAPCPTALLAKATEAEAVNGPVEVLGAGMAVVMPAALYVDSSIDRSNLGSNGDCPAKSECGEKSDCGDKKKDECDKADKSDCSEKSNCGDKDGGDDKKTACDHGGGDDDKKTACHHGGGDDDKKTLACDHGGGDDDKKTLACDHGGGDDDKKTVLIACDHGGGDDDKKSA